MIEGTVSSDGVPEIVLEIAERTWVAVIDTGFNGDLELPEELWGAFEPDYAGQGESVLAAGQKVMEDVYEIEFFFDGRAVRAYTTFVEQDQILIGTRLLRDHHVEIDFPGRILRLERSGKRNE